MIEKIKMDKESATTFVLLNLNATGNFNLKNDEK
jgi:hypothetical protein